MAVTLAEARIGMSDHLDQKVVETIQRNSLLLNRLTFDDAVTPNGSGSTLIYGYVKLATAVAGAKREVNSEYTPSKAVRSKSSVELSIMGASYEIDRVIAKNSDARINEVGFQTEEATKGAVGYYQWCAINGTADTDGFDGLDALLTDTANEIDCSSLDLSGVVTEAKAEALCEAVDEALGSLSDSTNVVILCNTKMKTKLVASARMLGYHKNDKDDFGHGIDYYGDAPIIDLKQYYNGTTNVDVIPTTSYKSDIYIVHLGLDGFHGVSPKGGIGIDVITPNFANEGAVHTGEVEIVGAVVLKNTLNGAVLRDITITSA